MIWPLAAGLLAAAAGTRLLTAGRMLTVAALLPALVEGPEVLLWFALAAAAALALTLDGPPSRSGSSMSDLQRHLMQCRRRGEGATVLALSLDRDDAERLPTLLAAARMTDTFAVLSHGASLEVVGLLEGEDVEPGLVEDRFTTILGTDSAAFGWARFPEDGVTLEVLLECARSASVLRRRGEATNGLPERFRGITRPVPLRRIAQASLSRASDGAEPAAPNGSPKLAEGSRVLVTGSAGFIGSHLSERLVESGYEVVGVDCFTDYYSRETKERNLTRLRELSAFDFRELDISTDDVTGLLEGVDAVFHLAGQAGVRTSFGSSLESYLRHNVLATQRLLEAAIGKPLQSFVYASSSSVYGNPATYPTTEDTPRRPLSPYGMTKVATEEIAGVYHRSYGVPVVGLRYFTAYGPRQRPDMAFARFLRRALRHQPIPIMGDGRQVRDFTFVDDIVEGTIAGGKLGRAGSVYNIGGAQPVELREAIAIIEELVGRQVEMERQPAQVGDARITGCDGALARRDLDYAPTTRLRDGLVAHFDWMIREGGSLIAAP